MAKRGSKKSGLRRIFELIFILVIVFAVIILIFTSLYFLFKELIGAISGNVVAGQHYVVSGFGWGVITILTGLMAWGVIKKLIKKKIFKIDWK